MHNCHACGTALPSVCDPRKRYCGSTCRGRAFRVRLDERLARLATIEQLLRAA